MTLPLLAPHLLAGGVFAFALSMLEVSDSLILAQRQATFPITKAIYDLFQLLGDGAPGRGGAGGVGDAVPAVGDRRRPRPARRQARKHVSPVECGHDERGGADRQPAPAKRRAAFAFPERLLDLNRSAGRLGPLLAWAVVFADIGTSVYYVPGLLFAELGGRTPSPAAAFVLVTGLAVILLALKYVDVSARYPDGGGVVSVATDAFSPTVGCVGGILICISYFLTAAISAVSGLQYLAGLFPALDHWLVSGASLAIILLGHAELRRRPRVGDPDRGARRSPRSASTSSC